MNQDDFGNLIQELIDENPFAIRAVLKILCVEFTQSISTLAVTCEGHPRLLVNPDFIKRHCTTDEQVKALICHEFLHILLRHTEQSSKITPAMHLAMDAVINAIIHRQLGESYSSMMSNYYKKARGLHKLLRPMTELDIQKMGEREDYDPFPYEIWDQLYQGRLVVDDIREIAENFDQPSKTTGTSTLKVLLGGHQQFEENLPAALEQALNNSIKSMNGSGVWRNPVGRGSGGNNYETRMSEQEINLAKWKSATMAVLKAYIIPNHKGIPVDSGISEYHLPVLSSSDRRALIRTLWSPFIPDSSWKTARKERTGQTQIYLDVSGSMHAEMPCLIYLLNRLRHHIQAPFWAFSTVVAPAIIRNGQLVTNTTGGTSLSCVLEHIALTKPAAAVILTDGYIEDISPQDVQKTRPARIGAIVSRDGDPHLLAQARIPYTQLERIPQ